MKYLLFAFHKYEANGGFGDFAGLFDSIEAAQDAFANCQQSGADFGEIVKWDGERLVEIGRYCDWNGATHEMLPRDWYQVAGGELTGEKL